MFSGCRDKPRPTLEAGVEILVYDVEIDLARICLRQQLPLRL